ncbi:MAG: hypothetical protein J5685_06845 [Clostridiales bacterium]|nr:hypothetical protein [Clostridiales bacterium]
MARDTKKIDAKGRFFIPAKQKEALGAELVVTNSLDAGYLCVYSKAQFEFVKQQLAEIPSFNSDLRKVRRFIEGEALYVNVDSQGRISVTSELWERIGAKPGDEICVFEYDGKLEICSKKTYDDTSYDLGNLNGLEAIWSVKGL